MGTANWQPKWWTKEQHESNWDRVKDAMKRDWEQTKNDFHAGGRDLDQDVGDTVKQAAGKQAIPSRNQPNASDASSKSNLQWSDVEVPTRYGYGARQQYGAQHADWDDKLEARLKTEWEETASSGRQRWEDVKSHVRRGYERARS